MVIAARSPSSVYPGHPHVHHGHVRLVLAHGGQQVLGVAAQK